MRQPLLGDGRVHGIEVLTNGRSCRLTSRLVIAADGASSRLARAVGIARHARTPRRWAVGAYFDGVGPGERAASGGCFGEMHLRHDRYIGIAPLPGGLVNACVVTADRGALQKPMQLLLDTLRSDPAFASRFADARSVTRAVCLGPLSVEASASGVPGLLLAGDAAGFIDPMTGDGLRFAMRGGELAAGVALNALERGRPDVTPACWALVRIMRMRRSRAPGVASSRRSGDSIGRCAHCRDRRSPSGSRRVPPGWHRTTSNERSLTPATWCELESSELVAKPTKITGLTRSPEVHEDDTKKSLGNSKLLARRPPAGVGLASARSG